MSGHCSRVQTDAGLQTTSNWHVGGYSSQQENSNFHEQAVSAKSAIKSANIARSHEATLVVSPTSPEPNKQSEASFKDRAACKRISPSSQASKGICSKRSKRKDSA